MDRLRVGIDVSKQTFTAAVWQAGQVESLGSFANTRAGFGLLHSALAPYLAAGEPATIHLIMEPTGGYEQALLAFAYEQGWQISLPNPKQVRDWAKGIGQRAKTDRQDARLLARYGAERQPEPQQALATEVSELDSLLKRREQLEKMLCQERNRQESLRQRPHVAHGVPDSVERLIQALEEELQQLEELIKQHIKTHAVLAQQAKRLQSVPGVGLKSVLPLLVLLHRWDALTNQQGDAKGLTALVGLDPQPFSSGTSVYQRPTISRLGDRRVRRTLYMAALGGIRGNNALRTFYQRLVGRGKKKKLALVAAARKILVWALAVFRSQTLFDKSRYSEAV